MLVISLCGPSASGKTTILRHLSKDFKTLPERYIELNVHSLDNQLVLSKWLYIGSWFDSVLRYQRAGVKTLITDRSPLDTVAYAVSGEKYLLAPIRKSIREISRYGVTFRSILVTAQFSTLMDRIHKRLATEPERARYHENSITFCRRAFQFYERNDKLWHRRLDTTNLDMRGAETRLRVIINSFGRKIRV